MLIPTINAKSASHIMGVLTIFTVLIMTTLTINTHSASHIMGMLTTL